MFHDQYVSHKWHLFVILYFMSCPKHPMDITRVSSFPVQSGGSLNYFSNSLGVGI